MAAACDERPQSRPQQQQQHQPCPGLVNKADLCYLNCVVQALSALQTLDRFLASHMPGAHPSRSAAWSSATLQLMPVLRLLRRLQMPANHQGEALSAAGPAASLLLGLKHMPRGQQDAHELLSYILDALETAVVQSQASLKQQDGLACLIAPSDGDEEARSGGASRSVSHAPSAPWTIKSVVLKTCRTCGKAVSRRIEQSSIVALDPSSSSLHSAFEKARRPENIQGVICEACTWMAFLEMSQTGPGQDTSHNILVDGDMLISAPLSVRQTSGYRSLVKQLASYRSAAGPDSQAHSAPQDSRRKPLAPEDACPQRRDCVYTRQVLRAPPILVLSFPQAMYQFRTVSKQSASIRLPETFSETLLDPSVDESRARYYVLKAVICHMGPVASMGHYVTFKLARIPDAVMPQWVLTSDETVRVVNYETVKRFDPYLAFYEQTGAFGPN